MCFCLGSPRADATAEDLAIKGQQVVEPVPSAQEFAEDQGFSPGIEACHTKLQDWPTLRNRQKLCNLCICNVGTDIDLGVGKAIAQSFL